MQYKGSQIISFGLGECSCTTLFHAVKIKEAQTIQPVPSYPFGSLHWKHSELFFEKKELIPALQQLLTTTIPAENSQAISA